jgi:hypothetical protein
VAKSSVRLATKVPFVLYLAAIGSLSASSFTFSTPSGARDVSGTSNPIDASAVFVVNSVNGGTNNQLQITLTNLESNPAEDGQILDALTFQVSGQTGFNADTTSANVTIAEKVTSAVASINTSTGVPTYESTCDTTTTTGCSTYESYWTNSVAISGTTASFNLCDTTITSIGCSVTDGHAGGIIGPTGSGGAYTNGNNSGDETTQNVPYLYQDVTFTMTLGSGDGSFTLSGYNNVANVIFGFGEESGDTTIEDAAAPEPSSLLLMAGALAAGLLAYRFRHKLRRA